MTRQEQFEADLKTVYRLIEVRNNTEVLLDVLAQFPLADTAAAIRAVMGPS